MGAPPLRPSSLLFSPLGGHGTPRSQRERKARCRISANRLALLPICKATPIGKALCLVVGVSYRRTNTFTKRTTLVHHTTAVKPPLNRDATTERMDGYMKTVAPGPTVAITTQAGQNNHNSQRQKASAAPLNFCDHMYACLVQTVPCLKNSDAGMAVPYPPLVPPPFDPTTPAW